METLEFTKWKEVIGTSTALWTILQMLSPVPTCYHFYKKKAVGDMIVTPYVAAFTSTTLWLLYGMIINDKTVIQINTIASILQCSYVLCYYIYCIKKVEVLKQMVLALVTILGAILYSSCEVNSRRLLFVFGTMCSFFTILFFASPLANMCYVIKIWNSQSLPRLLIATTFIVSLQWVVYGYLVKDNFIVVTNFLGTLLSGLQLILICIIPRELKSKLTVTV